MNKSIAYYTATCILLGDFCASRAHTTPPILLHHLLRNRLPDHLTFAAWNPGKQPYEDYALVILGLIEKNDPAAYLDI